MFHVRWANTALDELAAIWTNAESETREAITAASDQLEKSLANDAATFGESRTGAHRIAFDLPLGIQFMVERGMKIAKVYRVWLVR